MEQKRISGTRCKVLCLVLEMCKEHLSYNFAFSIAFLFALLKVSYGCRVGSWCQSSVPCLCKQSSDVRVRLRTRTASHYCIVRTVHLQINTSFEYAVSRNNNSEYILNNSTSTSQPVIENSPNCFRSYGFIKPSLYEDSSSPTNA
jgi:hypothetical protein